MGQHDVRDEKPGVDAGRRKLVKAAAIAGGAAAAVGALPGEWKKPLATVGGLPAHAQTSDNEIAIRDASVTVAAAEAARRVGISVVPCLALFSYEDPLCEINDTATLWAQVGPCGTLLFDDVTLASISASITSDPCAGNISFGFESCPFENSSQSIAIRLSKGLRHSNTLNASFTLSPDTF